MPITVSGTSITFNDSTTQTTAATGTVSSVATGNGLQGGTITTTGTLSLACPGFNTVGSYCGVTTGFSGPNTTYTQGSNYPAGSSTGQLNATRNFINQGSGDGGNSGTWKWMMSSFFTGEPEAPVRANGIACRVS